jgi:hypothetical protein
MLRALLTILAFLAAPAATAQSLRTVESWTHASWQAATMVNTASDRRFCTAQATSLFDQVLRIVFYEDADAFLEITDPSWKHVNGAPLKFHLIVDRDETPVIGQGWDGKMSLDLLDEAARDDLLARLSNGSRLDVRMPNRSRVAQFPLDGAGPAIAAAETCWAAIRAGGDYQP